MTKVYMVLYKGWAFTTCFGIYSTPEKAYARDAEIAPYFRDVYVEEVNLNDDMNLTF